MNQSRQAFIYAVNRLLASHGMTKYELADRLGVRHPTIYAALDVRRKTNGSPSIDMINGFARAFGVSREMILKMMDEYYVKQDKIDEL